MTINEKILKIISDGEFWSIPEIANCLEVTEKTVIRCMYNLRRKKYVSKFVNTNNKREVKYKIAPGVVYIQMEIPMYQLK